MISTLRSDPTQLKTLRRVFYSEARQRVLACFKSILTWVDRSDVQLEPFANMVERQTAYYLSTEWMDRYIREAYRRGCDRAFKDVKPFKDQNGTRMVDAPKWFVDRMMTKNLTLNFDPSQPRAPKGTETGGQWVKDQTESPEFKAWFGDSKVVDENGKPLVVYHGTDKDFQSFDPNRISMAEYGVGFYFTETPERAEKYGIETGLNVKPVYLSLQNPLIVKGAFADGDLWSRVPNAKNREELTEGIKKLGYDGVIRESRGEKIEIVAFYPQQIKSATGNRGTFDSTDPDIRNASSCGAGSTGNPGFQKGNTCGASEDDVDRAGDDLFDLLRKFHNTNDKKIIEQIQKFSDPADLAALQETLEDLPDGLTLYRGENGKIVEQPWQKKDLLVALPWEGEIITKSGESWTTEKRWAERFARYADYSSKIPVENASPQSLTSRATSEFKGLSSFISQRVNRIVSDGISQNIDVTAEIRKVAKISLNRAKTIVETETTRAFSEAYLDSLEQFGITHVGVAVEWDARPTACPLCRELEGLVLTIKEIRGLIPRHPRCRCRPKAIRLGRYEEGQKRSQRTIKKAIRESVDLEGRKTSWRGKDVKISKKRPTDTVKSARRRAKSKGR